MLTGPSTPVVHRTLNPEVVILEFAAEGRGLKTGLPYNQRYISVVTVRAGHIVHYLDYWNPLVAVRVLDGVQTLVDALQEEKGADDATH